MNRIKYREQCSSDAAFYVPQIQFSFSFFFFLSFFFHCYLFSVVVVTVVVALLQSNWNHRLSVLWVSQLHFTSLRFGFFFSFAFCLVCVCLFVFCWRFAIHKISSLAWALSSSAKNQSIASCCCNNRSENLGLFAVDRIYCRITLFQCCAVSACQLHSECFNFYLFPYLHVLWTTHRHLPLLIMMLNMHDYAFNFNCTIQWASEKMRQTKEKKRSRTHTHTLTYWNVRTESRCRWQYSFKWKCWVGSSPFFAAIRLLFSPIIQNLVIFPHYFTLAAMLKSSLSQWNSSIASANRIYYIHSLFRMFILKQQSVSLSLITLYKLAERRGEIRNDVFFFTERMSLWICIIRREIKRKSKHSFYCQEYLKERKDSTIELQTCIYTHKSQQTPNNTAEEEWAK